MDYLLWEDEFNGTVKLGIKLVGTHAIISILGGSFIGTSNRGLWENNQLYQWIIGLLQIFIFGLLSMQILATLAK